jgi:hypothetical protein
MDLAFGNSRAPQLAPVGFCKIQVRPGPSRPPFEDFGIVYHSDDVLADLIATDTDMRADDGGEIRGLDVKSFGQAGDCGFRDSGRCAAPARMYGRNGAGICFGNEYGDAVGCLDSQHGAFNSADACITHNWIASQVRYVVHHSGMHLSQLHDRPTRGPDSGQKPFTIRLNGRIIQPRGTQAEIGSFRPPRRKGVNDTGNAVHRWTMQESYLRLALYL